jgi:hypothetical protein
MVMVVLDMVLLVLASRSEREGKRYSTVRVSLYYSAVVMFVELYLYLGRKATIEP